MEHYEEEKPKIPTNLLVFIVISALVIAFSIYYITNSPKNAVSDELASSEMTEGLTDKSTDTVENLDDASDSSSTAKESNQESSDISDEDISDEDTKVVNQARNESSQEKQSTKSRTISAPKKTSAKTTPAKKTTNTTKVTRVSYDGPTHIHTVKKNEFMSNVSSMYNFPSSEIKSLNGLSSEQLKVGSKIKVKVQTIHKVKSGEQLGKIAEKYHVKKSDLLKINGLTDNSTLKEGQKIVIPIRSPK